MVLKTELSKQLLGILSMSKRDYNLYIDDIIEAINKIEEYTKDLDFEKFSIDNKTVDAAIRNFEIIGEAAKKLSPEIKKGYSDIPWKIMSEMRNKLTHEYFGINKKILWKTIKEDLPTIKPSLTKMQRLRKKLF